MSNNLRTRNGMPFNFVNGLKVRGMDIESLIPGIEGIPEAGSKYQFAGNGSNKAFTLPVTPYNKDAVDVYVKQLYVHPDDYTLVGDTVTLTEAPPAVVAGETYNVTIKVSLTTLNGYVNANRVSFEGENLDDILEKSKPIANYAALRAYAGAATQVRITDPGIAGFFYYDAADAASADNGGTIIVATNGKRWKRLFDGMVNVKWFGAALNGNDDTAAAQSCLNYCASNGKIALIPYGTCSVSVLTVTNGIRGIFCEGVIKGRGTAPVATLVLGSAGNPVKKASFVLQMDQSAGDLRAVQGYDTQECMFTGCKIYGFVNSTTLNHYAFWMDGPCDRNVFSANHITLFDTPTQRGFGIAFYGGQGTAEPYGGFFSGTASRAQFPAVGNVISDNTIVNGSYAISIQFSEYNTVTGNYCYNQNHRSVYLANAAWGNTISCNVLKNYLSTAVLLGYNSSNNVVSGNLCENNIVGGEAAINLNTGSQGNLIESNKIRSKTNYGVYIATDAINNSVIGNDIGEQYLAAIAVENDWKNPRPTNAVFSRTNYAEPPAPYAAWSFLDMTGVSIKNNVIRAGYSGRSTSAIYIAQITSAGNTKTNNIEVSGNAIVSPDNISQNVYLFEESAGLLTDLRFFSNDFHNENSEISANASTLLAPWNTKISYFSSNKKLDSILAGEPINFADGDTTPSVKQNSGIFNARYFAVTNTTPTSIAQFDDGFPGQTITLRLNNNTTIMYGSATIRTKGLVNIVGTSTNQFVGFIREANVWMETWRNF